MSSQAGPSGDMDGGAPDHSKAALLIIDLINDFEFEGGAELLARCNDIYSPIRALKQKARAAGVPVIYVNDNFGRWQSSFRDLVDRSLRIEGKAHSLVQEVEPDEEDYFILKPKHSAFYQTPLDLLLKHLGSRRLVLTGVCTNSCILFTANDAYMRDLELFIPTNCVGSCSDQDQQYALNHMKAVDKATLCSSGDLAFASLLG